MLTYARAIWLNNPVRVVSIIVAAVVALAAKFGVILDEASVAEVVALVVPIVLGGEVARQKVTPWTGPVGEPSDASVLAAKPAP
jgi:hypothetical protein